MVSWIRVLAKPAVIKRFLKTKAGKKTMFKFARMMMESKLIQKVIDKFTKKNDGVLRGNKEFKKLENEYKELQKKTQELQGKLEKMQENQQATEVLAFSLGRTVVEMKRLLEKMQAEYQQEVQKVSALQYAQKVR